MTTAHASIDRALLAQSRALIRSLQTPDGAYPASPTFSAYAGYCWFRDGSFIADGMSAVGEVESAEAFFTWCSHVVLRYEDDIVAAVKGAASGTPLPNASMLPARFTFDGGRGADEWWDFQLDGFGTWLWALEQHCARHGANPAPFTDAVALTVDYLASSWERPCFDWWEEHDEHVHVSTLGCIGAGLEAAARLGTLGPTRAALASETAATIRAHILSEGVSDGHLVKWIGTSAVDGSLSALISPLGFIDPLSDVAATTMRAIDADLTVDNGVHRFVDDTFFGGGQWPLLSCFAGLAKLAMGDRPSAQASLAWAASAATSDLELPEQVDAHLLAPDRRAEWVERWGSVATPLLWAHGMILRLAEELDRS